MDVSVASLFFAMLTMAALVGAAVLVYFLVADRDVAVIDASTAIGLAFLVALTATAGSLYYSDVVGFEPCLLCWYQRITMYPLVAVLGVGMLRRDAGAWWYGLPLSGAGLVLSTYHYLLQLFPELGGDICSATVPCNAAYVWEFGFVSIPFMAGAGFIAISTLLITARRANA